MAVNTANARVNCIDGDTFSIGKKYYRLSHIDTPEKNSHGYKAASIFTCNWLTNNEFTLIKTGRDKYNRILVVVKSKSETLNKRLISECLAEPFYTNTLLEIKQLYKSKCKTI